MLGTEELHRFVQFINGDFLSLCLCRTHYCSHGLDSRNLFSMSPAEVLPMLQIWMDANISSKIPAWNEMCTGSECGSSSAFPLGMTSRGTEVPRTVAFSSEALHTGLCKLKRSFSGAFYPLDLTNQYLDFTKSFFFLKQALQQLTLGSEVAESTNNSCLLFILTAYTMKS